MAKKKIKIILQEKLKVKKPVKSCNVAIDDIVRIRNNEQAKLRRLQAKFKALPRGKKNPKKITDELRKKIGATERGINDFKRTIGDIRTVCKTVDGNKAAIKSFKLKRSAIDRKLKAFKKRPKDVGGPEYKKLTSEFFKYSKKVRELTAINTDIIYGVNKNLGFKPEIIADRLGMRKKELERDHKEDFDEEYFEELREEQAEEEAEIEGAAGGTTEISGHDYVEIFDEVFWQASQDFTKSQSNNLAQFQTVVIEYSSSISIGGSGHFKSSSLTLIDIKFNELVRWASDHEPYIRVVKLVSADKTELKYIGYWDRDGRPI